MSMVDWFLARSEAFKVLMMKFRDHKQDTIEAFSKVKKKHKEVDYRLMQHDAKIQQLERTIQAMKKQAATAMAMKKAKKKPKKKM